MLVDMDARDLGAERQVVSVPVVALEVTWSGLRSQGLRTLPLLAHSTFPRFQRVEGVGQLSVPIPAGHVPSSSRPFGGDSFPSQLLRLSSVSLETLRDDSPVLYLSLVFCEV